MATRVIRQLVDDLDGSEITDGCGESVEFSLRKTKYRVDLSSENVIKLEKALSPFIEAAAMVSTQRDRAQSKRPRSVRRRPAKAPLSEVRAWALDNGYEVGKKGRIAADIVAAYAVAQS